ncbi:hypothetical protein [Rosistilla oblonga]|uniref:hypothetical protein n=1 Tax=Rosistilla oblonga TaxID=2527990 RepID=UPI003A9694F9
MNFNTDAEEREYLNSIPAGARVVEQGVSMTMGWLGTTYHNGHHMCVKWDNVIDGGQLSTALTHGTRLLVDVSCPYIKSLVWWRCSIEPAKTLEPTTEDEQAVLDIERDAIDGLVESLLRAKLKSHDKPSKDAPEPVDAFQQGVDAWYAEDGDGVPTSCPHVDGSWNSTRWWQGFKQAKEDNG